MDSKLEKVARQLLDEMGYPEESVSAMLVTQSERRAKASALGMVGSVPGLAVARAATRRGAGLADGTGFGELAGAPSALVFVTQQRLVACDRRRSPRALCDVPLADLVRVGIERSTVTPNARVLVLQTENSVARMLSATKFVREVADEIAAGSGLQVEVDEGDSDPLWILKAFPVGCLIFFGICALLLSIPEANDNGVGSAVPVVMAGAAMVVAGVVLRRLLFRRRTG